MTLGELLGRISSRELSEWRAYLTLEGEDAKRATLARRAARNLTARKRRRKR